MIREPPFRHDSDSDDRTMTSAGAGLWEVLDGIAVLAGPDDQFDQIA